VVVKLYQQVSDDGTGSFEIETAALLGGEIVQLRASTIAKVGSPSLTMPGLFEAQA
jgi:hypothetical protein